MTNDSAEGVGVWVGVEVCGGGVVRAALTNETHGGEGVRPCVFCIPAREPACPPWLSIQPHTAHTRWQCVCTDASLASLSYVHLGGSGRTHLLAFAAVADVRDGLEVRLGEHTVVVHQQRRALPPPPPPPPPRRMRVSEGIERAQLMPWHSQSTASTIHGLALSSPLRAPRSHPSCTFTHTHSRPTYIPLGADAPHTWKSASPGYASDVVPCWRVSRQNRTVRAPASSCTQTETDRAASLEMHRAKDQRE